MRSLVGLFSAVNEYGSNPAGVLQTFRKLKNLTRLRPLQNLVGAVFRMPAVAEN